MAQINLTVDSELLKGLFTSDGKDEAFASLVSTILNQVLSAQASEQIGAQPYERSNERQAYRNGYRERELHTRVGNGLERLNEEIRRRERVIRIFPNEESLYRLLGALLMEIHDAWQSGKVYLDVTAYLSRREQVVNNTTQNPWPECTK